MFNNNLYKLFQIKMKSVQLNAVYKYQDSDAWLYEEFSAKVVLVSPLFIAYNNKKCVKVLYILIH